MKKVKTMQLSGNEYAKVNARMLEFRKDNPRGKIENTPTYTTIGDKNYIQFQSLIVKDLSDEYSASATGHARLIDDNKQKTFEKCETIAVGRALAFLGYGADGEIASSEEMEEFLAQKQEKLAEQIMEATEAIGNCESEEDLRKVWASLGAEMQKHVLVAKNAKKVQLNEKN